MKKLFTSFVFSFLLLVPIFVSAEEKPQWEVPSEIYSILKGKAGFTVYAHAHRRVDLSKLSSRFSEVFEQTPNYILGRPSNTMDYLLITKDGFFAGFTSKEKGAALYEPSNGSMLWRTVRNIAYEDTRDEDNQYGYFHFGQPNATNLLHMWVPAYDVFIPNDTVIYEFAASGNGRNVYKQLPVDLLKKGENNSFTFSGAVNGMVFAPEVMDMYQKFILFSGSEPVLPYKSSSDTMWKLENWLYPAFLDVRSDHWARENITWAFRTGLIKGYPDGRFQPLSLIKEGDFVVIAAKYFGFQPGTPYGHRTQQYYDFFKPYNLPLKGYTNEATKNGTVTRGQLAQVIAASQGAAYGPTAAVSFMYKYNLSSGTTGVKTFEDYHFNEPLTRAQISAFFQRMEASGITTLK
ncbi:S-layer homology domain-containing protein [Bacillus sp. 37MA]|uniref:S-layer homology domain-containing protein n=1 Tax=Bacillus sp. 37MA TaxID=1132442 RepID=UPI00037BEA9F|nr:S-layer homology domain-containing protein [Bacillus sp. 37MA]